MSKRRKKNGVLVVALILLLVFALGAIFSATNGFSDSLKSFAIRRNGKELILNDTKDLQFAETEEFEIVNMSSASREFSVKVYAEPGTKETDFKYTYGEEPGYSWKFFAEEEQRDFTSCFDITVTENKIQLKTAGIRATVLRYDSNMKLPAEIPQGDRFRLEIIVGSEKISLAFSVLVRVTGVELPEEIIFGT